jgi:hypothetical protein
MTFIPLPDPVTTVIGEPNLDAFSRVRVSNPASLMFTSHQYDVQTLLWDDAITAGGTSTHNANKSAVDLAVTTASGDKVSHRTIDYIRYQPGKSQQIFCTFHMHTAEAGLEQRVGYFDDDNGIFLELDDTTVNIVQRSKASGSVVNTKVAQASWNLDVLDGTGTSGLTLDLTKSQILVIDLQWLGVGRVRIGFDIGGVIVLVHEFNWANTQTGVYMTTANLPVCYEIQTTGVISGAATLQAICAAVASEGGSNLERGYPFSADSGLQTVPLSTEQIIMSLRPKSTFNSISNHGQIVLQSVEAYALDQPCICRVYYDTETLGGTPSWTSANTDSIAEYDTAATSFTSTHVLTSFFVPASTQAGNNSAPGAAGRGIGSVLPIAKRQDASLIAVTVVLENLTATATEGAVALNWLELR